MGRGLSLVTDRELGINTQKRAAYNLQPSNSGFANSYCIEMMECVFIEELSPGNLNVKTLNWDSRNGSCRLSEEGSVYSIRDVLGGNRGWYAREILANQFGVRANDFLLREDNATPDDVDVFFREVLASGILDGTKQLL